MKQEINISSYKIMFSGKEFGNMDSRFNDKSIVEANRKKLEDYFNKSAFLGMSTSAENTLIDVDDSFLINSWNFLKCDGYFTSNKQNCLTLFPADCIPLVIYSVKNFNLGLVHIGHKNALTGIHKKALSHMLKDRHEEIKNLRFYIGPSIRKESYYFDDINEKQKKSDSWKPYIELINQKYHIDLQGFIISELVHLGVGEYQIEDSMIDTYGNNFFSHRRSLIENSPEGRNIFSVGFSSGN